MALGYDTYYALPRLENYQQALDHYNKVKPIARDPHETRPLGRRNQKWVSIWQDPKDKSISVGYGAQELSSRRPIVTFSPSGVITLPRRNRWASASDNERIQRVLGTDVQTHQYDQWIRTAWYDGGERRIGYLPLQCNPGRRWDGEPVDNHFVRDTDGNLVFLNYRYPVTHKINRSVMTAIQQPYVPFVRYIEGIIRVADNKNGPFAHELFIEVFGGAGYNTWQGLEMYNTPPNITYSDEKDANIQALFALMRSSDINDWLKGGLNLQHWFGMLHWRENFKSLLIRAHRDEVLYKEEHKHGTLVKDRYRSFFLD